MKAAGEVVAVVSEEVVVVEVAVVGETRVEEGKHSAPNSDHFYCSSNKTIAETSATAASI